MSLIRGLGLRQTKSITEKIRRTANRDWSEKRSESELSGACVPPQGADSFTAKRSGGYDYRAVQIAGNRGLPAEHR